MFSKNTQANLQSTYLPKISMRQVKKEDLNLLNKIALACWPDHIRWNINRLAKNYWDVIYETDSAEIWYWQVGGEPAAFCIIVTDLETWIKEKSKFNKYNQALRELFSASIHRINKNTNLSLNYNS